MSQPFMIQTAAVLGAGTMGAQIAALLAGAGLKVYLYDLPVVGDLNQIARKAIEGLKKLQPSPLVLPSVAEQIIPANYQEHLAWLQDCDWVIEAVAEKLEIKQQLFAQIAPHLKPTAIVATNTSGLSISALAQVLPQALQSRFLGVHFFNPPRYLPLVELIAHATTDAVLVAGLETFLVSVLGKTVLHAKDTPNFIGNRLGVFSILVTCHYAKQYGIPLEVVDALTGKRLGRPKSATFRTADVVGLDVLSRVTANLQRGVPEDPWHALFTLPDWLQSLIAQKKLGQKTKGGVYEKRADGLYVWDIAQAAYRPATEKPDAAVMKLLDEKDPAQRMAALRASTHPQAQFLSAVFRELFLYAAYCLPSIAETTRDIDLAIRKGYGWKLGVFELWQQAGWQAINAWLESERAQGNTLTPTPLASWAHQHAAYEPNTAYSPLRKGYQPRRGLPVYQRQLFYDATFNETFNEGETLFENEGLRFWTLGDGVGIISFKTKMCTISEAVLDGMQAALALAEAQCKAVVIWQRKGEHFSAGADLMQAGEKFLMEGPPALSAMLSKFQQAHLAVRYSRVPVVAAVRGYAFGGGCELLMHCDRVVACVESYIGLVEVGVGLIPAAGGCKELALRASLAQDPEKALQASYRHVAMAEVAKSAYEAQHMGYLRPSDVVIANPDELLYVAKIQALALAESGYRPPLRPRIKVLGRPGIATIRMLLVNYKEGQQISEYDYTIADYVANVMCGGQIDAGSVVDEEWLLRQERAAFMTLVENEKTFQRIQHMLETGKPLRN